MSLEGTPTTPVGEKFELNDEYRERVKQSSGRLYDAVAAVCEGKELSMQFEQTPLELAGYKFTFESYGNQGAQTVKAISPTGKLDFHMRERGEIQMNKDGDELDFGYIGPGGKFAGRGKLELVEEVEKIAGILEAYYLERNKRAELRQSIEEKAA